MLNVIDSLLHALHIFTTTATTNFIENWINIKLITLLSQPQIAYELIEAGEQKTYNLQVQGLSIDGLNNSKDTTTQ